MSDKPKVNPAFLAALDHFATTRFNFAEPHFFVYTHEDGRQEPWTVEQTCGAALSALDPESVPSLKLSCLRAGMRQFGMHDIYERIMGEKLT